MICSPVARSDRPGAGASAACAGRVAAAPMIRFPAGGIGRDVPADSVELLVVSNDPLVIVALPDPGTGRSAQFVDPLGDGGFE